MTAEWADETGALRSAVMYDSVTKLTDGGSGRTIAAGTGARVFQSGSQVPSFFSTALR